MLSESEIRNWKNNEKDRITQIIDPTERTARLAVIATLDGVLNE